MINVDIYYSPSKNKIYTRTYIYFVSSDRKMMSPLLYLDKKCIYKQPKDLVYIGEL